MKSSNLNIQNKWLIRILFAVLFLYLILRAFFVEPLLDELGTLHWYIQTGDILNDKATLDANNHLLNSFFSHYFFRLFGDHLIVYRLLALISFPIYFFSAKKLVTENIKQFPLIVFIAIISIHWVFDYFSLSRGYAPSVAFLMLGFSYIYNWNKDNKPKHLFIILTSFILCLSANLSLFVPILLLFGYLHLSLFIQWKQRSLNAKIYSYILSLGFLFAAFKLFKYASKLKAAGALWWGSKAGLWEVTGKSVSKNIFFTDADYIKYVLILIFVLLTIISVVSFFKKGWKEYVLSIQFWAITLLLLSLLGTVALVNFMDVNYPEDRVAMYLNLLLIISFGSLLSEQRNLKWLILLLLWFPISFIAKVNLNTTIFSPKDRIHNSFYNEIQTKVGENDVLTADYVAHLCYSFASRTSTKPKMAVLNDSGTLIIEDYHLASYYSKIKNCTSYTCILYDSITRMKLYKRNQKSHKTTLLNSKVEIDESNQMYFNLMDYKIPENSNYSDIQITVEGDVSLTNGLLYLDLIQDIADSSETSINYNSTLFHWYFGKKLNYYINYSRIIHLDDRDDKTLKMFMYNPEMGNVKLSNFTVKIIGINTKRTKLIKEI